ncbi:18708_t:CDS:2, partial [Racocetra fulgida]
METTGKDATSSNSLDFKPFVQGTDEQPIELKSTDTAIIAKLPFPPKISTTDLIVHKKNGDMPSRSPNAFMIYRKAYVDELHRQVVKQVQVPPTTWLQVIPQYQHSENDSSSVSTSVSTPLSESSSIKLENLSNTQEIVYNNMAPINLSPSICTPTYEFNEFSLDGALPSEFQIVDQDSYYDCNYFQSNANLFYGQLMSDLQYQFYDQSYENSQPL